MGKVYAALILRSSFSETITRPLPDSVSLYKNCILRDLKKHSCLKLTSFGAWLDVVNFLSKKFIDTIHENRNFTKISFSIMCNFAPRFRTLQLERKKSCPRFLMMNAALCCVGFMGCHSGLASYGETRHGKAVKRSKGIKKYSGKFRPSTSVGVIITILPPPRRAVAWCLTSWTLFIFHSFPQCWRVSSIKDGLISWNDQFMKWSNWPCVLPTGIRRYSGRPHAQYSLQDQIMNMEGSLLAHLEGNDQAFSLSKDVLRQSINPFIIKTGGLRQTTHGSKLPNLFGDFSEILNR